MKKHPFSTPKNGRKIDEIYMIFIHNIQVIYRQTKLFTYRKNTFSSQHFLLNIYKRKPS